MTDLGDIEEQKITKNYNRDDAESGIELISAAFTGTKVSEQSTNIKAIRDHHSRGFSRVTAIK